MRYFTLAALLWAIVSVGNPVQAVAAGGERTYLPSELAADLEKYDGKHVAVRGYVVVGGESRNIFDSENSYHDTHGACLGLDGQGLKFKKFHRGYTKISGVFRKKLCGDNDVCLFWCNASGIYLDKDSNP